MEEYETVNRFYSTSKKRRQNTKVGWIWCFIFSLLGRQSPWCCLQSVGEIRFWWNGSEASAISFNGLTYESFFSPKRNLNLLSFYRSIHFFCCSLQSLNQNLPSLKPSIYNQIPILFPLIAVWMFATKFSSEGLRGLHRWCLSWNRVARLRHKNDFKVKYFHPSSTSAFLQAAGNTLHLQWIIQDDGFNEGRDSRNIRCNTTAPF